MEIKYKNDFIKAKMNFQKKENLISKIKIFNMIGNKEIGIVANILNIGVT